MLSPNGCSSAELPMKILLKLMPSVVDMDMFVTHVYDVAKVSLKETSVFAYGYIISIKIT
jgi:hypothetical protein